MPKHFETPDPDLEDGAKVGLGFVMLIAAVVLGLMLWLAGCGPKPAPSPSPSPSNGSRPTPTPSPDGCTIDYVTVTFERAVNHPVSEKYPYGKIWLFRAHGWINGDPDETFPKDVSKVDPTDCFAPPKFYQTLPGFFENDPMETPSYDFYVGRVKPEGGAIGEYTITACPYEQPPTHPGCRSVKRVIP